MVYLKVCGEKTILLIFHVNSSHRLDLWVPAGPHFDKLEARVQKFAIIGSNKQENCEKRLFATPGFDPGHLLHTAVLLSRTKIGKSQINLKNANFSK